MLIPVGSFAKEKRTFEIKDGHFYVNGKVTPILSGEMHYPRIPHQYWRHRLRMMRAMGLNTVATYVFWNLHETEPGKWDFEGDKNLAEYIRIAGEEGLMVILRSPARTYAPSGSSAVIRGGCRIYRAWRSAGITRSS